MKGFLFSDRPIRRWNGMQCSTVGDDAKDIIRGILPNLENRYAFGIDVGFGRGKTHSEHHRPSSKKEYELVRGNTNRFLEMVRANLNTSKEICHLRVRPNKFQDPFKEVNIDVNDIRLYDEFLLEPYTVYRFLNRNNPRNMRVHDNSRLISRAVSDPHAQFELGEMYERGDLVHVDWKESFKWYMRAMNNGNTKALGRLAHMYLNGRGITQNFQKAFKFFHLGARAGNAESQYGLGCMYMFGRGHHEDRGAGRKWLHLAAENGHCGAQFQTALMYMDGLGGMQADTDAGRKWIERARASGNVHARMFML